MSKIKNGGLNQYGTGPFKQQQFGTVGIKGVKDSSIDCMLNKWQYDVNSIGTVIIDH